MTSAPTLRPGTIATTLVLTLLLLAAWEGGIRFAGVEVVDAEDSPWVLSSRYERAKFHGQDAVVLLGSSRVLFGVSSATLASELGVANEACANLGLRASSPLPGLEAIADDEDFRGVLVVEVFPTAIFGTSKHGKGQLIAEQIDPRFAYARFESELLKVSARNFAFLNPSARPLEGLAALQLVVRGKGEFHQFGSLRGSNRQPEERWVPLEVEGASQAVLMGNERYFARFETVIGDHRGSAELDELLDWLERRIAKINARGGMVVFVYPPISRSVRAAVDARFPRGANWDRLAERFGETAIHFADYPQTREMQCPEGSHLEKASALAYSKWLGQKLRQLRHSTRS
jgi:hypothetical protein